VTTPPYSLILIDRLMEKPQSALGAPTSEGSGVHDEGHREGGPRLTERPVRLGSVPSGVPSIPDPTLERPDGPVLHSHPVAARDRQIDLALEFASSLCEPAGASGDLKRCLKQR
jgi:hypothetical protein